MHTNIRSLGADDLPAFMEYLTAHMADNGLADTPLFQPQSRRVAWPAAEKGPRFLEGWGKAQSAVGWLRNWAAFTDEGKLIGHVDLRARPEPYTAHRALFGVGVARQYRNQGIAKAMIQHAIRWARSETELAWLDLHMLGGNAPARTVYLALGFETRSTIVDMFRIDGQSVDDIAMTIRIR